MKRSIARFFSALIALIAIGSGALAQEPDPARRDAALDSDWTIGVEDVLGIVVWGEPALSVSVKVRPDGMISLPLIPELAVAGKRPAEIREKIATQLSAVLRNPNVTVIVEEINSYRVYFLGEVNNQGTLQFFRPVRVLQAIASAGGLTEFSKRELVILRTTDGGEQRIPVDYKKVLAGDSGHENVFVRPGDTLLVK